MLFSNYIKVAKKTESCDTDKLLCSFFPATKNIFINKFLAKIMSLFCDKTKVRLLHASLGINTEVIELIYAINKGDVKNTKEEIGDMFWYIAISFDAAKKMFPEKVYVPERVNKVLGVCDKSPEYYYTNLLLSIGSFTDILKRSLYYIGYKIDGNKLSLNVSKIYSDLLMLCGRLNIDPEQMLKDNMLKLSKRYPGGFSAINAIIRDKDNELSHIGG